MKLMHRVVVPSSMRRSSKIKKSRLLPFIKMPAAIRCEIWVGTLIALARTAKSSNGNLKIALSDGGGRRTFGGEFFCGDRQIMRSSLSGEGAGFKRTLV